MADQREKERIGGFRDDWLLPIVRRVGDYERMGNPDVTVLERSVTSAPDAEAHMRLEIAARSADTIGQLRNNVRGQINELAYAPAINKEMKAHRAQTRNVMEGMYGQLQKETRGYDRVQLAQLSPGVGGMNYVGADQSQAVVSTSGVHDIARLGHTLAHEAHPEKGHSSQAMLRAHNPDVAVVVNGQRLSITALLEGDVEAGTAELKEGSASVHRDDQPEEIYGEGQSGMLSIWEKVGRGTADSVLKKKGANAGNVGHLQKALWKVDIERSPNVATVRRIVKEAEETGHINEAREVLLPFVSRQRQKPQRQSAPVRKAG